MKKPKHAFGPPGTRTNDKTAATFWGLSAKTISRWKQAGVNPADITAVNDFWMQRSFARMPSNVRTILSKYNERLENVEFEWANNHDPKRYPRLIHMGNGLTEQNYPGMAFVYSNGVIRGYIEQVGDDDTEWDPA